MTAGLLIASVGVVVTSPARQVTPTTAPAPQMAILVDAPGTTGTVNLGGVTAGLDSVEVEGNLWAPGGPQLSPDIAVGAEPGTAVDGLVVPLVNGLSNGSGEVDVTVPASPASNPSRWA